MLLILLATFCVSLTAGRVLDDEFTSRYNNAAFAMPKKFKTKATKISLTGNLVEEIEFWQTNTSGRADGNHGYYKKIYFPDSQKNTTQYQIFPVTDRKMNVTKEVTCHVLKEEPSLGIPEFQNMEFKNKGIDSVLGQKAVRFESAQTNDEYKDFSRTLWAAQNTSETEMHWIPIRYEAKTYIRVSGMLSEHEIWEFYEFEIDFDEEKVFNVTGFVCKKNNTVIHTLDSEAVTKELMFMDPDNENHFNHVFNSFKSKYNIKYAHEEEHTLRESIFKKNMKLIASINAQNLGFKLGVNMFADRTPEEMHKTGYRKSAAGATGNKPFPYTEESLRTICEKLPKEVDLRTHGLVSPVQNELDCRSSWAFAATSAVEGALAKANGGRLLSLANQALVDCAWGFGTKGCYGGDYNDAYEWMMEYGLPTVEKYGQYQNKDGVCNIKNMTKLYPIKGYTAVSSANTNALKVAVFEHGPVTVAIHVSQMFGLYSSGVFYDRTCDTNKLNRVVTLVGYGEDHGELYWIIKNSWGPYWGQEGYMMISAKQDCGISVAPSYVVF